MEQNYFKGWESLFIQHRPFLVSFAFRMTGSLSEAEDIVQDTFIECAKINPTDIKSHKSWLTKVCSNKGLDHLKLAYKKRETYPGVWLPDSVPESFQFWGHLADNKSPDKNLLLAESLTTSFLLLIEKLTPEERVVYLLGEVFEYSFEEIAHFLEKSEEACRKIAQRARQAVLSGHIKFDDSPSSKKLLEKFFNSLKAGDQSALQSLLADDSELWSDGGGKASVFSSEVIREKLKIAGFFAGLGRSPALTSGDFKIEFNQVNSRPGLVISKKLASGLWEFDTILSFEMKDDQIARIYAQRNPDKLKNLMLESLDKLIPKH